MKNKAYRRIDLLDPNLEGFAARLVPDEAPFEILIEGSCPQCGDWMQRIEPIVLAEGFRDVDAADRHSLAKEAADALRAAGIDPVNDGGQRDIYVVCDCSGTHTGAPEGAKGCGAAWTMELAW